MLTNLSPADLRLTTAQQRTTGQILPSDLYILMTMIFLSACIYHVNCVYRHTACVVVQHIPKENQSIKMQSRTLHVLAEGELRNFCAQKLLSDIKTTVSRFEKICTANKMLLITIKLMLEDDTGA
jgi:hypothetical protein